MIRPSRSAAQWSPPDERAAAPRLYALRLKLGLLLGMVVALAVAIPAILEAASVQGSIEEEIRQDNLELARAVGALVEQRVAQTFQELDLLVGAPGFAKELEAADEAALTARLVRAVHADADLSSILVVDREGVVVAHSLPDKRLIGQRVADEASVVEPLRAGIPAVGLAFRSTITERAVVPLGAPVRTADGRVVGAVRAFLSLARLGESVENARGGARGFASVIDAQGRFLTSPDRARILTDVPPENAAVRLALAGQPAARRTADEAGAPVFAAAVPIGHGWVVQAQVAETDALAPFRREVFRAGFYALGAAMAATLAGIIFARRITEPLLTLLQALRSIRHDDLSARLPRSTTSEVAWLADELEMMRTELGARTAEREAALRAFRESEAQYRAVVETICEVVFQTDADGRWTFLNRAWTEVTGSTVEEALGRSFLDWVHPEDVPASVEAFGRLAGGELAQGRYEVRYVTSSRAVRWVEVFVRAAHGPDGRVVGTTGTLMDVTERRHAEQERARLLLREQEARVSEERAAEVMGIIQHMPCGVLVFDATGCLTLANERAIEMLSPALPDHADAVPGDGVVPLPGNLLDDRLLGHCRSLVGRALEGASVRDEELHLDHGEDRVLLGSAAPLHSPEGRLRGAVAVIVDVTRERRLVHDLVLSEATLRHTLQSLLVLHEVGRALSSTLDEEEIGRRLVESCLQIAQLDAVLVSLVDERGRPREVGAAGEPSAIEQARRCDTARQARAAALRAAAGEPALATWNEAGYSELEPSSARRIVLEAQGRALGVLEIYGYSTRTAVMDDALASLASHAATAFENARLYGEVADRERRLQDALRQLLLAQEEERRRIAYELHDGLAQVAAATHLSLQAFAAHSRPRSPQTRQALQRSLDLARRVVREARQVIAGLRPTALDDFGLERALRLHVQELAGEGLTVAYDAQLGPERLPGPVETVLYRIGQEALTNVRKHAATAEAAVTLRREGSDVVLVVTDAGVGFEPVRAAANGPGQCIGLVGMRERAALVGGRCVIESRSGGGTRVDVRIPLAAHGGTNGRAEMPGLPEDHGHGR